ncbi:MAG: helix-turn-helix domain-containing protein [Lactobacillus mulieris]|uniref:Helix-turn-helix domain-containing protein n=1 Tax=Lactobacillus mulieris TaxID=2508708 RepID=A0AAP3M393_9LACO|nr:helix-turn-helix transcriptional regulator [Lactobacillus mulieris]MCF1783900.1 helix-turn-helix domain-containing protein [Lactobacillus mulieris]MCT7674443.1 helix-turn-helix domain-containing protein [Lactobacillus mulieris]MCT7772568.1 helix-turn-helix domain-containing protein [Lactobacillus mulieris]MCW8104668.1 helix-turn-helix domain-containing protein [Lactobacillus mulieris]MCZ3844294.1 helix-turn-helix domain-containing protein [Lactobacillus mulieris]
MNRTNLKNYLRDNFENDPDFAKDFVQCSLNVKTGIAIINLRKKMGLTREEFARLVNMPQATILQIEQGDIDVTTDLLIKLATTTKQHVEINFSPIFED